MATNTAKQQAGTAAKAAGRTRKQGTQTARTAVKRGTRSPATRTQARQTAQAARTTAEATERTVVTVLRDSAYATVGAGDQVVANVRELLARAGQTLRERADEVPATLEQEFDALARRGRDVVGAVRRQPAAERAGAQIDKAVGQAKAARGQTRKAVSESVTAVEETGEAVTDAASEVGAKRDASA